MILDHSSHSRIIDFEFYFDQKDGETSEQKSETKRETASYIAARGLVIQTLHNLTLAPWQRIVFHPNTQTRIFGVELEQSVCKIVER